MSSGKELSAVVFGQHVHPILILVIFFFWGCLKDKVYKSNTRTEELKGNNRTEIANIPCRIASKGKSELLSPVRGMFLRRGTAFSTPPVICEF
jgi:hypothetical protein